MNPEKLAELAERYPWLLSNRYGETGPTQAQSAILAFPSSGGLRATVHMRWKVWKRLYDAGLVDGIAGDSSLTAEGRKVAASLRSLASRGGTEG